MNVCETVVIISESVTNLINGEIVKGKQRFKYVFVQME